MFEIIRFCATLESSMISKAILLLTASVNYFFLPTPPAFPFLAACLDPVAATAGLLPVVEVTVLLGPKKDSNRP